MYFKVKIMLILMVLSAVTIISCDGGSGGGSTTNYSVSYNGNFNTGGNVPVDINNYGSGVTVTVAEPGTLVKAGSNFVGWNTSADGSGSGQASGSTFEMVSANVILYAQWSIKPVYSVSYNGNFNTGGSVPVDANNYEQGMIVAIAEAGTLVKSGSIFVGWNTVADGSGSNHSPGSKFYMGNSNVVLYAQWTVKPVNSVTYNGNGNTGGEVPVDSNYYEQRMTVTVAGAGTLIKSGSIFVGWNTNEDGSGSSQSAGSTFAMGISNIILYAQWTVKPVFTVTYNGNGNTIGGVPVDLNNYEQGMTVTAAGIGTLGKSGSTFIGWNTSVDGRGSGQAVGSTLTVNNSDITLYAQWTTDIVYTVTYSGNGSLGGAVPGQTNHAADSMVTVSGNIGYLVKIPAEGTGEAFKFGGWNTKSDGSGNTYTAGAGTFVIDRNTTLFAKWVKFELRDVGPAGGLVFYDKGVFSGSPGWRYLEAAPSNQSEGKIWSNVTNVKIVIDGEIDNGPANTQMIINQPGHSDSAAKLCDDLVIGAYSDWFLPSKQELDLMYQNLRKFYVGNFNHMGYWSSSQYDASSAAWQIFDPYRDGPQLNVQKYMLQRVRAARDF